MTPELFIGNYLAWAYFQSIPSEKNSQFVSGFKKMYGDNRVTDFSDRGRVTMGFIYGLKE